MEDVQASAKGGNDDTGLAATAQKEVNADHQKGAQLVVTSQQQHSGGTREETQLVAASQNELNNDAPEGAAELVVTIQSELIEDTQVQMEAVAASQKGHNDNSQEGAHLVVTSEQELINETREETELVVASQTEINNDAQEGAELVLTIQNTLVQMKPVAASQKEVDDNLHEGTPAVVAPKLELSDDTEGLINTTQEGTELVVVSKTEILKDAREEIESISSQKEPNGGRQEGTELLVASEKELSDEIQEGAGPEEASQKELSNDLQEGAELVEAPHKDDIIEDTQKVTESMAASQKGRSDSPQEGIQVVVNSQQQLSDDTQEKSEMTAASPRELSSNQPEVALQTELIENTREGTEVVETSKKELNDDTQEATQPVVAFQQQLNDDTEEGTELAAALQKANNNHRQEEEAERVLTPQQELSSDNQEKIELVAASEKELSNDTQEGTQRVETIQQEHNDDILEGTELAAASQNEPSNELREGADLMEASRKESIGSTPEKAEMMAASLQEVNGHPQERRAPLLTSQEELNNEPKEGTELVVPLAKEVIHDPQLVTKLRVASQREAFDAPQAATELVVASRKGTLELPQSATESVVSSQQEHEEREEPEEHGSTDRLAKGTSMINNVSVFNSLPKNGSAILSGQSVLDENPTEGPFSTGRKMRLKDMARRRPHSAANTVTEDREEIQTAVAKKYKPRRNLPKRAISEGHSISTWPPPPSVASDAIQQAPIPHSSPNIHNNSQAQYSPSPGTIAPFPTISQQHRQQLPCTQVSPLRFDELLQATNSVAWRPVVDCDTPRDPPGAAHCVHPPSASASGEAPPLEDGGEFSFDVTSDDVAGLPSKPRGGSLESEFPPFSTGKPPRPPPQSSSRGVKRGLPDDFTRPSIVQQNVQQTPFHTIPYPNEVNEPTTNHHVDPHGQRSSPLTGWQPETPPASLLVRGFEPLPPANLQSRGPSSLSLPEVVDRPDNNIDLPSRLPKRQKRNPGPTPQQKRRNLHKRRLQQLRTQVLKKLTLWGRESNLVQLIRPFRDSEQKNLVEAEREVLTCRIGNVTYRHVVSQEADAVRQDNRDQRSLIMSEEQREDFVQNMVGSCQKDPHLRAKFLAAVKQIANLGVLHSSACLLMETDPSGKSHEVFKASKGLSLEPEGNSSAGVHLYKAVEELHKEGAMAIQKRPPGDDTMMCSLGKTADGAWEFIFPNVGPQKRARKQIDDTLDEPLWPST